MTERRSQTGRQCKGLVGQEVRKMCRAHMARMEDIAIHSYDGNGEHCEGLIGREGGIL